MFCLKLIKPVAFFYRWPSSKNLFVFSFSEQVKPIPSQNMVHLKHDAGDAQDLPERILELINVRNDIDTNEIASELNEDHQRIVGAVKSLQSLGNVSINKNLRHVFCLIPIFTGIFCKGDKDKYDFKKNVGVDRRRQRHRRKRQPRSSPVQLHSSGRNCPNSFDG